MLCRLFRLPLLSLFLLSFCLPAPAQDAGREARVAQWESYPLAAGNFTRYVDRKNALSFFRPSEWQEEADGDGTVTFRPGEQGVGIIVVTEALPDGLGVANYAAATLQQLRKDGVSPDSLLVRPVRIGGLEGREVVFEMERDDGETVRQAMWLTAAGPRGYAFALFAPPDEMPQYEPLFKRLLLTVRVSTPGARYEEFETLRARFGGNAVNAVNAANAGVGAEGKAAEVAEAVRTARRPVAELALRLKPLAEKSPAAVADLLLDADPQVRSAASSAFALTSAADERLLDLLLWAADDGDADCRRAAARALAAKGRDALAAVKKNLPKLGEKPAVLMHFAAALGDEAAKEFVDELLKGDDAKRQVAALKIAAALPLKGWEVPHARLFAAKDAEVVVAAIEAVRERRAAGAAPALLNFIGGEYEYWAASALGEFNAALVSERLTARVAAIDKRLEELSAAKNAKPSKNPRAKVTATFTPPQELPSTSPPPPPAAPGQSSSSMTFSIPTGAALYKAMDEETRLALARGVMADALEKIAFRSRFEKASDDAARRAVLEEALKNGALREWAATALRPDAPAVAFTAAEVKALGVAPTTGETLFPHNTSLYLMAPDFAATLDKFNAALSGIQMETVRDQTVFTFLLKTMKARLAASLNAEAVGDAGAALGVDFKAPVALAAWPHADGAGGAVGQSAMILRVNDRARFERALVSYVGQVGDADSFAVGMSAAVRFVGVAPSFVPAAMLIAAAPDTDDEPSGPPVAAPLLRRRAERRAVEFGGQSSLVFTREEMFGALPVTAVEKLGADEYGRLVREAVYVAYLDSVAVVAPSRESLVALLKANNRPALAGTKAFAEARKEAGELVFFSQLGALLEELTRVIPGMETESFGDALKALGLETGALRLTPTAWETHFNLHVGGATGANVPQVMRPFKAADLRAPHDILPRQTMLYAGCVLDPAQTLAALVKAFGDAEEKPSKLDAGKTSKFGAEIAALVPHLQGEVGAALISLSPMFAAEEKAEQTPGGKAAGRRAAGGKVAGGKVAGRQAAEKGSGAKRLPAVVGLLKLKSGEPARLFREGKLFTGAKLKPGVTALGAPVAVAVDKDKDEIYLTVTDDYLIFAESAETLRLLEAPDKLAASRDYARTAAAAPASLTLLVAYSQGAAFDDLRAALVKGRAENPVNQMLPVVSAVSHAFHSQRIFVSMDGDVMKGQLAVSFDREGRYSVGDLEKQARDFDVANAIIAPKGLSIYHPTRLDSVKLRVKAHLPGVIPRVKEDVSKFAWNRVEASDERTLTFKAEARRIPEGLTVKLPVTGAEFAPDLRPTARIASTAPEIVKLAREIAGDDKDARSVARKLGEWTYQNLKWKRVDSDTLNTLASREADCFEHSELYVALARSLGLPARVVTGAAYSSGSFGAHAWVEVYVGQWAEVDPTWGLTDYVDATHLRFADDAFINYAMLKQVELEVAEVRAAVAEFQRDPAKLLAGLTDAEEGAARELVFDLGLTAEAVLGAGELAKLEDKRRDAAVRAFERRVNEELSAWEEGGLRVLRRDVKGERASFDVLRDGDLLRVDLIARDGAWYVAEITDLDDDIALFADALKGAAKPGTSLAQIRNAQSDRALKLLDAALAAEGERPALLLLKARELGYKHNAEQAAKAKEEAAKAEAAAKQGQGAPQAQGAKKDVAAATPAQAKAEAINPGAALLRQVMARWPDYAPALFSYANESIFNEEQREPIIAAWKRYAQLRPFDPRPWHFLAHEHEKLKQFAEAESAFREMMARDPENVGMRAEQSLFFLSRNDAARARASLAEAFKVAAHADEVFDALAEDYAVEIEDVHQRREEIILAFPAELAASRSGLRLLADAQDEQGKKEASLKTMERVLKMEPEAYDYNYLAYLNRALRRYKEAAAAAEQAIKLEEDYAIAHLHLACALAQLNRRQEAVAALTKLVEKWPMVLDGNKDEADLTPLAALPEFKALLKKAAEAGAAQGPQKN